MNNFWRCAQYRIKNLNYQASNSICSKNSFIFFGKTGGNAKRGKRNVILWTIFWLKWFHFTWLKATASKNRSSIPLASITFYIKRVDLVFNDYFDTIAVHYLYIQWSLVFVTLHRPSIDFMFSLICIHQPRLLPASHSCLILKWFPKMWKE